MNVRSGSISSVACTRSVIVPSKASAAMPIVSERVGWGWIVRPMSAASAPISIASAASAIRSPADGPTMPHPMIRSCSSSNRILVTALVATQRQRSSARRPGKDALAVFDATGLGFDFGHADPRHLRIGIGNRRNDLRVENAVLAGRHFGCDLRLMHRLMGEHRLADHVSDGKDMRNIGAHLLVDRDEAALVDSDARGLRADHLAAGTAADGDQQTIEQIVRRSIRTFERHAKAVGLRRQPR